MKMHLLNIANQLEASEQEKVQLVEHFKTDTVTPSAVRNILHGLRNKDFS